MNTKVLQIFVILLIGFVVLNWLRSDGSYDFDIRSAIPFMRGRGITLHDWGGLILLVLGVWGVSRLYRSTESGNESSSNGDWYDEEDDVDADV